jgi:DNA-binding NtrC family response regulator
MSVFKRPYNTARHDTLNSDAVEAHAVISLAISANEANLLFLEDMFNDANWKLYKAHTYREAMLQLDRDGMPIIICECRLPDGSWKDVLSHLAPLGDRPRLIVISKHADETLWSEVLDLGGFDLLGTPLKEFEAGYVIGSAWLDWKNEQERATRHVHIACR